MVGEEHRTYQQFYRDHPFDKSNYQVNYQHDTLRMPVEYCTSRRRRRRRSLLTGRQL